jgi:hypothetical protein
MIKYMLSLTMMAGPGRKMKISLRQQVDWFLTAEAMLAAAHAYQDRPIGPMGFQVYSYEAVELEGEELEVESHTYGDHTQHIISGVTRQTVLERWKRDSATLTAEADQ